MKIGQTTDAGWGCCVRVAQMMFCHALLRHRLGDYTLNSVQAHPDYERVLSLVNDNLDGPRGAFSIQNVSRMGIVYKKLPGDWFGPSSIAQVFASLNKVYSPFRDFKVCNYYENGLVYFNKIRRLGAKSNSRHFFDKDISNKSDEQINIALSMKALFATRLGTEIPMPYVKPVDPEWLNGVLVLIPMRLGLTQVEPQHGQIIKYFFKCPLNVGAIGGRSNEAFYFVGTSGDYLLFLDPHLTQQAIPGRSDKIMAAHASLHEQQPKCMHYSRLQPSITFAFYIRTTNEFAEFKQFMYVGKEQFADDWVFSLSDEKPKLRLDEVVQLDDDGDFQII